MIWYVIAIACSVTSAIRGVWSPCGLSMLSSFTPMSERSRGGRYWTTVLWFVGGATVGGAALGVLAMLGAAVVGVLFGSNTHGALIALGACFAIGSLFDFGIGRPSLPHYRRQVDETWLRQFRRWFTASGFGAQIGFGLATYIMTSGVYLVGLTGILSGQPLFALAAGTTFGLTRGLMLLLGSRITTSEQLYAVHQRLEAAREPVRYAMAVVLVLCASGAIAVAIGTGGGAVALIGLLGCACIAARDGAGRQVASVTSQREMVRRRRRQMAAFDKLT